MRFHRVLECKRFSVKNKLDRSVYKIVSQGYYAGKTATIEIDGIHYSKNGRGFNIVVYDNVTMKVIDKVCFDIIGGGTAIR